MRYYVAGLIIVLSCLVAAHAQIIQFSGAPVPQGPGGGGGGGLPPVVTASAFTITAPTTNNELVGNITASQSPTNYVVASCAGCTNYFQFANPASPTMTVTPTGAANMTGVVSPQTFSPVARASNATGNGQATITVTVNAVPVVTAGSYTIAAPAASGLTVGTVTATGTPTSFSVASCSGCTGYFTINNAGVLSVTQTGSQSIAPGTYNPVVQASNSAGNGSATQTVTVNTTAPVVTAGSYSITSPTSNGQQVGMVIASHNPTSFSITSCSGCTSFFSIDPTGSLTVTATGSANITPGTYDPVVQATNAAGSGSATQTVSVIAAPQAPVVTAGSYSVPAPSANGQQVGSVAATGAPTSFSITSCSGCTGYFAISNVGLLTVTATGATNIVAGTYSPIVQASNTAGNGSATQTVTATASAPSVVSSNSFIISSPTTLSQNVGTVTATNSPVNFQITSCPGCTGYFAINSVTGVMTVASAGVANINGTIAKQVFNPVVQVGNGGSTGNIPVDYGSADYGAADFVDVAIAGTGAATQTVTAYADGKPVAGTCTPQRPTILTSYGNRRPAWQVVGVDYCVGPTSGQPSNNVTNFTALAAAGCTIDPSVPVGGSFLFHCAANATINGYDIPQGYFFSCEGNNVTFTNNRFTTTKFLSTSACTNLTFSKNTVTNSQVTGAGTNPTFTYNYFNNSQFNDNVFNLTGGGAVTVKFNMLDNNIGAANTDWLALGNGSTTLALNFNTVYQSTASSTATNGYSLSGPLVNASDVGNNTIITLTGTNINYDIGVALAGLTGTVSTHDNYVDTTGSASFCAANSASASSTFTNNLKLTDGSTLTCAQAPPPPVITAQSFSVTKPVVAGQTLGTVSSTNSPTSWAITSCSNCGGFFTIPNGVITISSAGATAINAITVATTYSPTVQASNGGGNSNVATETITAAPPAPPGVPVVTAHANISITSAATTGNTAATIAASNSPTSWAIVGGNSAGDFTIDNSGNLKWTAAGAARYNGGVANRFTILGVRASNASGTSATSPVTVTGFNIPAYDHVVVVMEENHGYGQIIGSNQAPYINSLANTGALMTNSFAVSHPSEPNYFALWSGSTQGITDDGNYTENATSLGGQLKAAGITVKGYVEDTAQRKHDPWESFTDSSGIGVNFNTFPTGPDYSSLPKLSFVIPNQNDDMHDGTIAQGDSWLQSHLGGYATWAKTHNSLLIVTWDEDENTEGNHIATIFYGANVATGPYGENITHYNVLGTLEGMFGQTKLANAANAPFILDIWQQSAPTLITQGLLANNAVNANTCNGGNISPYITNTTSRDGNPQTANKSYSLKNFTNTPFSNLIRMEVHDGDGAACFSDGGSDRSQIRTSTNFPLGTVIDYSSAFFIETNSAWGTRFNDFPADWHDNSSGQSCSLTASSGPTLAMNANGTFRVWYANDQGGGAGCHTVVIDAYNGSTALTQNTWHYVRVYTKLDPHNSTGFLQVWLDGVQIVNLNNILMGYVSDSGTYINVATYRGSDGTAPAADWVANVEMDASGTNALAPRIATPLAVPNITTLTNPP